MFAVIFEVVPKPERRDDYLKLAKLLRLELQRIDGFLDNVQLRRPISPPPAPAGP